MKSYIKLCKKFDTLSGLGGARAILGWDANVMMPEAAEKDRARQIAAINNVSHDIITSSEVSDLLDGAESEIKDLDDVQIANLKLIRKQWLYANAVPADLIEKLTYAGSECEMRWRSMKIDNNFAGFSVFLQRVFDLTMEVATAKSEKFGISKYDTMLDQYEGGARAADIDPIFDDLESYIKNILPKIMEKQGAKQTLPDVKYDILKQKEFGVKLMQMLGFDFEKGRIDISAHPFCGGTADDVRITTRYDDSDWTSALMGVLHETGHALYEMNLPVKMRGQPVGEALGMSIHESQSLLVEMQICRNKNFIKLIAPMVEQYFGASAKIDADKLYKIYNYVEPSLIRIDADEVTYPLHIIIRYKLEKELVSGNLKINDLPNAWNEMYKKHLGVNVPSDREGCMQDIHWSDGSFGYFPCYSLGALNAAQLFETAISQNLNIYNDIGEGNFSSIIGWLAENVHSKGSQYNAKELMEKVTGKNTQTSAWKKYIETKYIGEA